jgi:hypothetical protein
MCWFDYCTVVWISCICPNAKYTYIQCSSDATLAAYDASAKQKWIYQNVISMGMAVWQTVNCEPMAGGIAKAAKSPVCPCITPEPHAGGKFTKCISTDVTPEDTAIPVWAVCLCQGWSVQEELKIRDLDGMPSLRIGTLIRPKNG